MDPTIASLLIAAGQTFVGALGSIGTLAYNKYYRENSFDSPLDLWYRGLNSNFLGEDDSIMLDCLISPYNSFSQEILLKMRKGGILCMNLKVK